MKFIGRTVLAGKLVAVWQCIVCDYRTTNKKLTRCPSCNRDVIYHNMEDQKYKEVEIDANT